MLTSTSRRPALTLWGAAAHASKVRAQTITKEVVWNEGVTGGATGGGVSAFFPLPTYPKPCQRSTLSQSRPSARTRRAGHRGDADPATGYIVRVDGQQFVIGGTSAVAPLWAGLIALLNQQLRKSVGFINPLLYSNPVISGGSFHDIVSGNNDASGHLGGYRATNGWDACTGLGSPDGARLMNLSRPSVEQQPPDMKFGDRRINHLNYTKEFEP